MISRKNIRKVRITVVLALCCIMVLMAGCASSNGQAEATTMSEEEKTKALFAEDYNEDGTLKNINLDNYITKMADYKNLDIPKEKVKVSKKDVNEQVKTILSGFAEVKEITDRKIKEGDVVRLSYEVMVGDEVIPEESVASIDIEIGSGVFESLEKGIKGKKPGKIDIDFTLPDPYENDESLSGKEAVIKADVAYIVKTRTPELTDDFVKANLSERYNATTVDEFKDNLKTEMVNEKKGGYAMEELLKQSELKEVPETLVENCTLRYIAQTKNRAAQMGISYRDYLKQAHVANEEAFKESVKDSCTQEASLCILVDQIANKEGIKAQEEDLNRLTMGEITLDKLREFYPDAYLYRQALNLKVRDFLAESN